MVASDVETSCCTMIDVGAAMYASAGIENTKTRKNMGMRLIISVFFNEKCCLLARALMAVARNIQHRQMERCTGPRFSNWRFLPGFKLPPLCGRFTEERLHRQLFS